ADGLASRENLEDAFQAAFDAGGDWFRAVANPRLRDHKQWEVYLGAASAAWPQDAWQAGVTALQRATQATTRAEQWPWQCAMLRDIFGNPFRPVTFNPAWRTTTVTSLAQAIYDERAFDRLPILADALEDAGCISGDTLGHCRSGGEHVRGCWVV